MNYVEWNSKIGAHFFGEDSGGRRVVMCVTRDTLAEISEMSPEDALQDFVAAVLEGPDWNRIRGCTLLETKVHCCLHVDPQWGQHWSEETVNPEGVNELQDLSSHLYWDDYSLTKLDSGPNRYPPYLAYLAAFVLAWTERKPNRNGNDYYETVLDLLDEDRERWQLPRFYRLYSSNGINYTINDVWKDLMRFCEAYDRAELIIPDNVLRVGNYVGTPKFCGLMKASDLRNLGRLFFAMEEAGTLTGYMLEAKSFVSRIVEFRNASDHLSITCLIDLENAANSDDLSLAEAYGRLLQSKYRDFDGLPEEEDHAPAGGGRRTARLLRVMDRNGSIKVVCRLRSEGALKKLPLEEDGSYVFCGAGVEVSATWVSGSEWFSPMDVPIIKPLCGLELECTALRIKAAMASKDFLVLHNPGLYFLAGCKVEVDEVEKGRQYVLLASRNEAPAFDGFELTEMNILCPQGMSCWSFCVPHNATPEGWPEFLPPLLEEKEPKAKLSFSGFRLEPRTTRFPVGLPVRIRCSVDNVELVATANFDGWELQKEDEGVWVLKAKQPGVIILSFCNSENQQDQEIFIENLHEEGVRHMEFPKKLMGETKSLPYPEALVELVGGVMDPRITGDHRMKTYFATAAPSVKVDARNLRGEGGIMVLLGGEQCTAQGSTFLLPTVESDQSLRLEVKDGETLLAIRLLKFSLEPEIQVNCASLVHSQPVEVRNTLVATVRGDPRLVFDWEVRSGETRMTGGTAMIGASGTWEGVLLAKDNARLEAGKIYEVRFGFGGNSTESRWFKFRNTGGANVTPQRPPLGGFNSLGNAFKSIQVSGKNEGGRP